jgi:CDK-activating kinase assembly factor MAT1
LSTQTVITNCIPLPPNTAVLTNSCETCIDRIFTLGPAPCPQCARILRKAKFRKQTFEDTLVEREVDIRHRINKSFNKRREDFKSLRAYNDYLEEVEDIIFNLVNGTDIKQTEAKVSAYEAENKSSIAVNEARSKSETLAFTKQEQLSRQQREQSRLAAAKADAEEAYERERQKTDLIRDLASSEGSAEKILARNKAAALKRSSARRISEETTRFTPGRTSFGTAMEDIEMEDEGPFDPLGGEGEESSLYVVHQDYDDAYVSMGDGANDRWLDQVKNDKIALAGGFIVHDVYKRGLFEAYAGLGCILSDELTAS